MSRCKACDVILNEQELKKIDRETGFHLDLCNTCLSYSDEAMHDSSYELIEKEIDSLLTS
jgi:hypothetical protein